jgi:3-isopropylmalate dehydratase small subunit
VAVNLGTVGAMVARPGHPEDVVPLESVRGRKIDSVFIGSCTNGRYEDLEEAAKVLRGRRVAPGVVLKIVPSTDAMWRRAMKDGLFDVFKASGALISNAGCGGCAAGQVGQNGPGEVTVSTGNRNFAGKQGKGEVFLASPETVAASAVAGVITTAKDLANGTVKRLPRKTVVATAPKAREAGTRTAPTKVTGRAWVIPIDNIDTDMIFHNRHLAVTEREQMGQYAFGNLAGYERFAKEAKPGDIVVVAKNFGAGSSRQQAVDCFLALGVQAIVAESFGAIYERNAINAGMPIVTASAVAGGVRDGDEVTIEFATGRIEVASRGLVVEGLPFSDVQLSIYQRGGLLAD